jgi:uncharacterized membrane protein YtjA (UPF0391 family)
VLRWITVLTVLAALTGLMTFGVIPTNAIGLTRILLGGYCILLLLTIPFALLRHG